MSLPKTPTTLPKKAGASLHKKRARQRVIEQQIAGLEVIDGAAVCYQLERVRCGKASCRLCSRSPGHGPYWYAYWRAQGRTRSIYIGKKLRSVREALDAREGK